MQWQPWVLQWAKLSRQEADLALAAPTGGSAPPRAAASKQHPRATEPNLHHVRTQLAKNLTELQALCASVSPGAVAVPGAARRRQHCETALAQLQATTAAQLQQLQQAEAELTAEYESAVQRAAQLLQPPAQHLQQYASGSSTARRQPLSARGGISTPASPAPVGAEVPAEVAACDAYLQRHGPTGGWHPDDHAEFERILRACRGNYAHCVQLCCQELGLLHSEADIAQHAGWHEQLQQLQLSKRLAVQRWRQQRQAGRAVLLEQQAEAEAAALRQAEQEGAQAAAQLRAQQQAEQREAVQEWRQAREVAAAEEQRREAIEERERQRRETLARQQRQQENQQLLLQRRADKEEAAAGKQLPSAESGRGSSAGSQAVDPVVRQRLQERNQVLLQRRVQQVRRRSEAQAGQADLVQALQQRASDLFAGAAKRDPGRLLQGTATSAMRQLAVLSEERSPQDSGYIRHIPRRATPAWCGGARLQG